MRKITSWFLRLIAYLKKPENAGLLNTFTALAELLKVIIDCFK